MRCLHSQGCHSVCQHLFQCPVRPLPTRLLLPRPLLTPHSAAPLLAPCALPHRFYRELRSALVDMDDFFSILRTTSSIKEGSKPVPQHHSPPALATTSSASATSSASSPSHAGAALNGNGHSDSSNGNSTNGVHHYVERELAQEGGGSRAHSSEGASSSGRSGPAGQGVTAGGLHIELRDVRFSYTPNRQILKGVSLTAEPGQSVAVVGSSGSGELPGGCFPSVACEFVQQLQHVCTVCVRCQRAGTPWADPAPAHMAQANQPSSSCSPGCTTCAEVSAGEGGGEGGVTVSPANQQRLQEHQGIYLLTMGTQRKLLVLLQGRCG